VETAKGIDPPPKERYGVIIFCASENDESCNYAKQVARIFVLSGWLKTPDVTPAARDFAGIGVTLVCGNAARNACVGLDRLLSKHGEVKTGYSGENAAVYVRVGRQE